MTFRTERLLPFLTLGRLLPACLPYFWRDGVASLPEQPADCDD
jgi:hypothetical protein